MKLNLIFTFKSKFMDLAGTQIRILSQECECLHEQNCN